MLFDSRRRQAKSPLKTGGSFEFCFLLLGKQTAFSWGRTGSKETTLARKSIPIFKAQMHIYRWLLGVLGAFRSGVINPVYPAGRTSVFFQGKDN